MYRDIDYCHLMGQIQRTEVEQGRAAAASSQFLHAVELVAFGSWRLRDGNMLLHTCLMSSGVSTSV